MGTDDSNGNGARPATPQVFDLDVLKPAPVIVHVLGADIDISFVSAAVAMDIEQRQNRIAELTTDRDPRDSDVSRETTRLMAEIVELVARRTAPEITADRLLDECTTGMLEQLITLCYRHMYGPRTAERYDAALAELQAEAEGAEVAAGGGPTAPAKSGRSASPRPRSSSAGRRKPASG